MAWLLRNVKFPDCPVGTPLGHLEVTENETGNTYFFVKPNGERTQLHVYVPDPTYCDSALLDNGPLPISVSLYQRAACHKPKPAKKLPHDAGDYQQGPIVSPARHFEAPPQVNLDVLQTDAATRAVLHYLQANPKCSKEALHQRFHCAPHRMLAILENPDLVTRTQVGPMRVYSVKK